VLQALDKAPDSGSDGVILHITLCQYPKTGVPLTTI
jgi:hypothetical protein